MLEYNRQFSTLENYWMADHMHFPAATELLRVIDMYEHSYHMDYWCGDGPLHRRVLREHPVGCGVRQGGSALAPHPSQSALPPALYVCAVVTAG